MAQGQARPSKGTLLVVHESFSGTYKHDAAGHTHAQQAVPEAPNVIDYFSLDVEGAEWRVMQRFPFTGS